MPSTISFVHFDSNYLTTTPGIVKVSCLVLTFVGFLIVQVSSFWSGYSQFFKVVTIIEFIFTGFLFVLYLFCIPYVYNGIPWLRIEFFWSVAATIVLALASLLLAINGSWAFIVAACIGFLAMFAYGYDALLKYRHYSSGPTNVIA